MEKTEKFSRSVDGLLVLIILLYSAILITRPEYFFSDDSYFYVVIAHNFAHGLGSTFNEITLANGYHPLWMLACAAVYATGVGKMAGLHLIAAMIAALNIGTLGLLAGVLRRIGVRQWQLGGALLISFLFGTQLGSEGALSAFFLSAVLYAGVRLSQQYSAQLFILTNVLIDFAVLSRLDNVFICVLLGTAFLALAFRDQKISALILPLGIAGALHFAILGSYLATNIVYFHSLLPISGMVKSNVNDAHRLGSNIANIGKLSLIIILASITYIWTGRKTKIWDGPNTRIIFYVLFPFTAGVLLHAAYIVFFMSSETRWSWYYTSWVVLASLLISISIHQLLTNSRWVYAAKYTGAIQAAVLLVACALPLVWAAKILPGKFEPTEATWIAQLESSVPPDSGVKRILVFDYPGRIAFFSSMEVLAADGLTQDLKFQRDIASEGMLQYLAQKKVKVFVGPPVIIRPVDDVGYCDHVYLGSTRFTCVGPADAKTPVKVEFFSRVPFKSAGELNLPNDALVWSGKFAAWKIL